jgi:Ca-activated chloride channel family protein
MYRLLIILISFFYTTNTGAQYYLRGEIKDNRGKKLEGVNIHLKSKGTVPFFSGKDGDFGIPLNKSEDSIFLSLPGYEPARILAYTSLFQQIVLEMLPSTARLYQKNLSSVITDLKPAETIQYAGMGESYSGLIENGFIKTNQYPQTGFSLNIDKAAFSNIRRFLINEMFVPVDAVRTEEMLNYFSFEHPNKNTSQLFSMESFVTDCPWNTNNKLLLAKVFAPKLNLEKIPPSNLVFLIDVSGSMDHPNRLPLLQSAFKLLTANLRNIDTISIVTYGGNVSIALYPTSGTEKKIINDVIDSLSANGDTPGENAIKVAYNLAKGSFIKEGNNRVILATDGDFNVGQRTEKELEDLIVSYKEYGISLTCLGVGMGNYKDSKLETLSKKGNGNFAYIDQIAEAEKVLVKEFTSTLFSVAKNTILQIAFNKEAVTAYRLIGFDNKKDAISDSSATLIGGEIGSGHVSLALFEIELTANEIPDKIAEIKIAYESAINQTTQMQLFQLKKNYIPIDLVDSASRRAITIAAFAGILRKSKYTRDFTYSEIMSLAATAYNPLNTVQNELLYLIQKAEKIYNPSKRKKTRIN